MNRVKLGEITELLSGCPFDASLFNDDKIGLPLIRVRDVNSGYAGFYYSGNYDNQYLIKNGDILVSLDGDFKVIEWRNGEALLNQRVCKINPKANLLNREYLLHYLPNVLFEIHGKTRFTTVKHLSTKTINNIEIPLPPLPDQLHIASLLSKAENLIAQRKESIRLLDEFLKSTFLEMFGDPVRNEKGWKRNSLSKFGSLKNGLNYTRSESGVSVRCLGVGDFKELSKLTDMDSLQVLNLTSEPNNEYFLKDADLVFVRSNGNRELVGRCLLVCPNSTKVTFSGFCIRYRIENEGLNPIFISHLFRVPIFRTAMLHGGKGANIQNISQQTLEKLKIPTPPIELQTQFAQIVSKTEALKTQYQQSLTELENLYGSLSQKAFKGELTMKQNI